MKIVPLLLLSFLYHIHTHEMLNIPTEIDGPSANQPSTNVPERKSLKGLLSDRWNLIHTITGNTTNNKTGSKQRKKIDAGNQGNKQYNSLEIHKDKRPSLRNSQSSRLPEIEYNTQWRTPQQSSNQINNTGIFIRNQTSTFYKCMLVNFRNSEKVKRCLKYRRRIRRGQADLYSYDEDYYGDDLMDYDVGVLIFMFILPLCESTLQPSESYQIISILSRMEEPGSRENLPPQASCGQLCLLTKQRMPRLEFEPTRHSC